MDHPQDMLIQRQEEAWRAAREAEATAIARNGPVTAAEAQEMASDALTGMREGVTFEEAACYGIQGRIVWAIHHLGRDPRIIRVYRKAQYPNGSDQKPDSSLDFEKAILGLVRQSILELVKPDRVRFVMNSPNVMFAVKCHFCLTQGPPANTTEQAKVRAIDTGWGFHTDPQGRIMALCPSHKAGSNVYPGGANMGCSSSQEDAPKTRGERRRKLKLEKKQRRQFPIKETNSGERTRVF